MTEQATPARDALEAAPPARPHFSAEAAYGWDCGWMAAIDEALADPTRLLAALVESGWRPTADQLRAMGGERWRGLLWVFEGVDGD